MPWRPPAGVRWMEVDDGIVVYDAASGRFADLNESAAELWLVLSERDWSAAAAVQHLTSAHDLEVDEAEQIVTGFLADLGRSLARRGR